MTQKIAIDTNIVLEYPEIITEFNEVGEKLNIHSIVLEELDNIIHNAMDEGKRYKARIARNAIKENMDTFIFHTEYPKWFILPAGWDEKKNDNLILRFCAENNMELLTNDIAMQIKAKSIGVEVLEYHGIDTDRDYKGFKIIEMSDEELARWYESDVKSNIWDLKINEYLLLKNNGVIVEVRVWTKEGFRTLNLRKLESCSFNKIVAKDVYQSCVIDSLTNNAVTMVRGSAGTGKSLLTAAYAMSMLEKGKIGKIVIFTNPVPTKNSAEIGFLPGTREEKLLNNSIGNMLMSKFGSQLFLNQMINQEQLLILPFSDLRGFDTSGMKALIWITEAQNLDVELMKLAIQRVGDDCQVVIDGDYDTQIDKKQFEVNNGMRRVSEVFSGKDFYGEVELQEIYRSKWTEIAELL